MTVSVDEARTLVEDAESALGRLDGLPLGYVEREILAAVRGVLAVADAALSVAAAHEHALPFEPDPVTQVTIAPPANAPDGGPVA